jgi:hypothetical protein
MKIQRHLAAVGRVAASWAKFEFAMNDLIWQLANVGINEGACITAQIMSPSNRLRSLTSLARLRGANDSLISDLNKFGEKADGFARQRNRIVHDPWLVEDTGKVSRMEITADKKLVFELRPTDAAEIEKLFADINLLVGAFFKIRGRLVAELPPWPQDQYIRSRQLIDLPYIEEANK